MENLILVIFLFSFLFYFLACFLKPKFFSIAGLSCLCLGFLGNIFLICRHFFYTHRLPLTNISETLLSAVTIVVFIYLVSEFKRHQLKYIGLSISLISCLGLIASFWFLKRPPMPLLPALQSKWLVFHVSSCIIAYCFFTVAFISAVIYLFTGNEASTVCDNLNRFMHRSICLGFSLLTLGIILGSIWGKSAWGHWWNWDPKETWALVTWLIYASYIHGRLFGNWSEKRLSTIAILGFLACLFTYLGVNFLLKGLHSYA